MLTVVPGDGSGHADGQDDSSSSLIDEIVREGARWLLAEAPQAEVDGAVEVTAPRVNDKRTAPRRTNGFEVELVADEKCSTQYLIHRYRQLLSPGGPMTISFPRQVTCAF